MKNVIFAVIAILSASVCFAEDKVNHSETRFEHLFKSFAYVDTTPCKTINRFYRERCEVVAGNSESIERMIEFETRRIRYEIKSKPGR